MRAAKLPEFIYSVFLSDLHADTRPNGQVLNQCAILGQDSLIIDYFRRRKINTLYTHMNSSAVGLSRLNISNAEISNPPWMIISTTRPMFPSFMICGLMTPQVQLLKSAVVLKLLCSPKKKSSSLFAEPTICFISKNPTCVGPVTGISDAFLAVQGSERIWRFDSGDLAIGRPDQRSPFLYTIVIHQLNPHDEVARHVIC
jgi:hypothetical protein